MRPTEANSFLKQSPGSTRFIESRRSFFSLLDIASPFVEDLMRFVAKFRAQDGSELDIETAAREAVVNAIVHGNESDPNKRVYVACRCSTDGEVCITIQDEGRGFDVNKILDPTAPENLLLTSGRGIYFMKMFMDEVSFEQGGSVVHMRKKPTAAQMPRGNPISAEVFHVSPPKDIERT